MPTANVKLSWSKSVSPDVVKATLNYAVDGVDAAPVDLGPEVEEFMIVVGASKSAHFSVTVTDSEGLTATSTVLDFTIGDLVAPQPPTNLAFQITGVNPDAPPNP